MCARSSTRLYREELSTVFARFTRTFLLSTLSSACRRAPPPMPSIVPAMIVKIHSEGWLTWPSGRQRGSFTDKTRSRQLTRPAWGGGNLAQLGGIPPLCIFNGDSVFACLLVQEQASGFASGNQVRLWPPVTPSLGHYASSSLGDELDENACTMGRLS